MAPYDPYREPHNLKVEITSPVVVARQFPSSIIRFHGGLDTETPLWEVSNRGLGKIQHAVNYEVGIKSGYQDIAGYERFDGKPAPSAATYIRLLVVPEAATNAGYRELNGEDSSPLLRGTTVANGNSGAADRRLATIIGVDKSGADIYFVLSDVIAAHREDWSEAENIFIDGTDTSLATKDLASVVEIDTASTAERKALYLSRSANQLRADIVSVPGAGPVLGVWMLKGVVYAVRNNRSNTSSILWKSSDQGWVKVELYRTLDVKYINTDLADGTIITQGSASARVKRAVINSGDVLAGVPANQGFGYLVVGDQIGSFGIDAIYVDGEYIGQARGNSVSIRRRPHEVDDPVRIETISGSFGIEPRIYGVDGKNRGFEFDGEVYVPIRTGMDGTIYGDEPGHVEIHGDHLFFSFGRTVQHSGIGNPYRWTVRSGASELATDSEITGMLVQPGTEQGDALAVFNRHRIYILYGATPLSWSMRAYREEIGAYAHTLQEVSQTIFFDDQGIRSLMTVQAYGNFQHSTISQHIKRFIAAILKKANPVASCIVRNKNQYRLFLDDGSGLYVTFDGHKLSGIMPVLYPQNVAVIWSGEDSEGKERLFFGSDNGMVYELDRGTSFDGGEITAFLLTHYSFLGSNGYDKRFYNCTIEAKGSGFANFALRYYISYHEPSRVTDIADLQTVFSGIGEISDLEDLDQFDFNGQTLGPSHHFLKGVGENIAFLIIKRSSFYNPVLLSGVRVRNKRLKDVRVRNYAQRTNAIADLTTEREQRFPGQITDVTVTVDGSNAEVGWSAPNQGGSVIVEYQVQRAADSAFSMDLQTFDITGVELEWLGLSDGVYHVRVRARNSAGVGSYSSVVSFTITSVVPVAAPTNVQLALGEVGVVSVDWNALTDTEIEANSVDGYIVQWRVDSDAYSGSSQRNVLDTATILRGLTNYASEFHVRVAAYNSAGTGAFSAEQSIALIWSPSAPVMSLSVSGSDVAVSWMPPLLYGLSIDYYIIEYTIDPLFSEFEQRAAQPSETMHTLSGLASGTTWYVRMYADVTGSILGDTSSIQSIFLVNVPAAPTGLELNQEGTTIIATWDVPSDNGSAITGYTLQYDDDPLFPTPVVVTIQNAIPRHVIFNVEANTAYYARVQAINLIGSGVYGDVANTLSADVPDQVVVDSIGTGTDYFEASWTAPENNGSSITGYIVTYSNSADFSSPTEVMVTDTTVRVDGLSMDIWYFYVQATNAIGNSELSATYTGTILSTPPQAQAPDAPANLQLSVTGTTITATWDVPDDHGGTISGYTVQYSTDSTFAAANTLMSATNSATFMGVGGETVHVRVLATSNHGNSMYGVSVEIVVPSTQGAPDVPANLMLATSGDEITATWDVPANNGLAITGYTLQYDTDINFGGSPMTVEVAPAVNPRYTLMELEANTRYYIRVLSTNEAGSSAYSSDQNVITSAGPVPDAITDLSVSETSTIQDLPYGDIEVTLMWTRPNSHGESITGYALEYADNSAFTGSTTDDTIAADLVSTTLAVDAGSTWYFKIRAESANGEAANSNVASIVIDALVPSMPAGLSATHVIGTDDIELAWSAPVSDGGSAITGYTLEYSNFRGFHSSTTVQIVATATSHTLMDLPDGRNYYIRILARNLEGSSSYSATIEYSLGLVTSLPANGANVGTLPIALTNYSLGQTFDGERILLADSASLSIYEINRTNPGNSTVINTVGIFTSFLPNIGPPSLAGLVWIPHATASRLVLIVGSFTVRNNNYVHVYYEIDLAILGDGTELTTSNGLTLIGVRTQNRATETRLMRSWAAPAYVDNVGLLYSFSTVNDSENDDNTFDEYVDRINLTNPITSVAVGSLPESMPQGWITGDALINGDVYVLRWVSGASAINPHQVWKLDHTEPSNIADGYGKVYDLPFNIINAPYMLEWDGNYVYIINFSSGAHTLHRFALSDFS